MPSKQIDYIKGGATLTLDWKILRELCKFTGADIIKGDHWVANVDMDNITGVLAILTGLTVEHIEANCDPADLGMISEDLVEFAKLRNYPTVPTTNGSGPSSESTSV